MPSRRRTLVACLVIAPACFDPEPVSNGPGGDDDGDTGDSDGMTAGSMTNGSMTNGSMTDASMTDPDTGEDMGTESVSATSPDTGEDSSTGLPEVDCTTDRECVAAFPDLGPCAEPRCVEDMCAAVAINEGGDCDDGDVCNGPDACTEGECTHGPALDCDDTESCTDDTCDPVAGCQWTPVPDGTDCDDGNLCNGAASCESGACSNPGPLVCNDGNPCTSDACDAVRGCPYDPVADDTPCADAFGCNGDETCQDGACANAPDVVCDDVNDCTSDACVEPGVCQFTNLPEFSACGDAGQCLGGNCACFVAGTMVDTEEGPRAIETIAAGDRVATYDQVTGAVTYAPILRLEIHAHDASELMEVRLDDGHTLGVTADHHFWVDGDGWVRARELERADALRTADGTMQRVAAVASLAAEPASCEATRVYNVVVDETKTYFVGDAGVLVHSCSELPPLNYGDPEAFAAWGTDAAVARPPLVVFQGLTGALVRVDRPGSSAATTSAIECPSFAPWAVHAGVHGDDHVVLDVSDASLRLVSMDALADSSAPCRERAGVRVPLHGGGQAYAGLVADDRVFVSYFDGNRVSEYAFATDGTLAHAREHELVADRSLGLSDMLVAGDALFVAASGYVCFGRECDRHFAEPYLVAVPLARGEATRLGTADPNPSGLFRHPLTDAAYVLNTGTFEGGEGSVQRILRGPALGPEIRMPDHARIGRAFALGERHAGLLAMSGDHLYVLDTIEDELVAIFAFDGETFTKLPVALESVGERTRADLHAVVPDPVDARAFFFADSKNEQLVHVTFDPRTLAIEVRGRSPLSRPGRRTVPSWMVWSTR